jgi:hypothetical protein
VTCAEEKALVYDKREYPPMAFALANAKKAPPPWYPPLEARMRQFIIPMNALYGQGAWCFTGSAAVAFLAHQFGNAFGDMVEPGDMDMLIREPIRNVRGFTIRAGDDTYTFASGTESSATFDSPSGRSIDISKSRLKLRVLLFDGGMPINHILLEDYIDEERNKNAPKIAVLRQIQDALQAYSEEHADALYVNGAPPSRDNGRRRRAIGQRMMFDSNDENIPKTLFGNDNDDENGERASKRQRTRYGGGRRHSSRRRHSRRCRAFGGKSRRFSLRAK